MPTVSLAQTQPPAVAGLGWPDWAVVAAYLGVLVAVAVACSRKKASTSEDYFLGGRRMPVWAVAASLIATATSAATFIGGPEEAYAGNLTYISTNIGVFIALIVVAFVFIPAFYRERVTTVYDLLEHRFGLPAKIAASWTFMIGRVLASGSRIYVAALPAGMIMFAGERETWHLLAAIGVLSAAGILTAFGGGIRTVIWTDVAQVCVFILAAVAAMLVLLHRIPIGIDGIYETLRGTPVAGGSKLTLIDVGLDQGLNISRPYTLMTAIFGFSLLSLAAYGTDHDLSQRMLTCRSAVKGGSSAFAALLINLPMLFVFMSIGLLLYIFYQRPDIMGSGGPVAAPADTKDVFLWFILNEMPAGLKGLMMAGLFAVGIGSLNSALAAMSATFMNDAYRPLRPGRSDRHYVVVGRVAVVGWGVVLGLFACWCVFWHQEGTLINFVLRVMTFAYAGLLGVFLTALCTRRGNSASAIASLVVGFVLVLLMEPFVWEWWTSPFVWSSGGPGGEAWKLADVKIAFPWRLTIATLGAFLVCFAGRPRNRGASRG